MTIIPVNHWNKLGRWRLRLEHPFRDRPRRFPSFWSRPWMRSLLGRRSSLHLCTQPWFLVCHLKSMQSILCEYSKWLTLADDIKWPVLHVGLDGRVFKFTSDQSFSVKNGVRWVHCYLVLGGIPNQTFRVSESHIRGCCTITLNDMIDLTVRIWEYIPGRWR